MSQSKAIISEPVLTFDIHSIKCSVKLGQKVCLNTVKHYCDTVLNKGSHKQHVCFCVREGEIVIKAYPNFIVLSKMCRSKKVKRSKWSTPQNLKHHPPCWYQTVKYTLFKYSQQYDTAVTKAKQSAFQSQQKQPTSVPYHYYRQHCNISGLKSFSDIVPALNLLAQCLQLETEDLFLQVDNLIATTKLPSPISKLDFLKKNPQVKAFFQLERFPSIILKPNFSQKQSTSETSSLSPCNRRRRKKAGLAILLYSSGSAVISGAKSVSCLEDACTFLSHCFVRYKEAAD